MAAATIPKPGTKLGHCKKMCKHLDCAESRQMAASACGICGKAIGYERRYYRREAGDGYDHADCYEASAELAVWWPCPARLAGSAVMTPTMNKTDIVALSQQRDELLSVLIAIEWAAWNVGPPLHQYCTCCGRWKDDGHSSECRVAAIIRKANGYK